MGTQMHAHIHIHMKKTKMLITKSHGNKNQKISLLHSFLIYIENEEGKFSLRVLFSGIVNKNIIVKMEVC